MGNPNPLPMLLGIYGGWEGEDLLIILLVTSVSKYLYLLYSSSPMSLFYIMSPFIARNCPIPSLPRTVILDSVVGVRPPRVLYSSRTQPILDIPLLARSSLLLVVSSTWFSFLLYCWASSIFQFSLLLSSFTPSSPKNLISYEKRFSYLVNSSVLLQLCLELSLKIIFCPP